MSRRAGLEPTSTDFSVPVRVQIPSNLYRRLRQAADAHEADIGGLVVECIRRAIATGTAPTHRREPPAAKRSYTRWTPEEDQTVRRMHADGQSDLAIAGALTGRARPEVGRRRRSLGLTALYEPGGRPLTPTGEDA